MSATCRYASVILPLKLGGILSYRIPDGVQLEEGSWVRVQVGAHTCTGVVESICPAPPGMGAAKIKDILEKVSLPSVEPLEINFWKALAAYYMCSLGEVLKAACPLAMFRQMDVKSRRRKSPKPCPTAPLPTLSDAQQEALEAIRVHHAASSKPVLLHGVTGSGKTEIYMHLAAEAMKNGRSVLYLVPEIAMSKQLQERLSKVFGDDMLTFHSALTAPKRKAVTERLTSEACRSGESPVMVLGTRSAVFLPVPRTGLVIIDEEHDSSLKQEDPAPRYNGRDAALLKASLCGAKVLLGSATPSLESHFNVATGKYFKVSLESKYHTLAREPEVRIIDTAKARRLHDMKGSFAREALAEIGRCVKEGSQVLVFRSRRAYSSSVQCSQCGFIPLCPKCNVPLTYHKYNDSLECHYCGRRSPMTAVCPVCGAPEGLVLHGAGTEKLEEELREYFPQQTIGRFDADTARLAGGEAILNDFAAGRIDILVGTQMITKGFDFDNLSLVVVVAADSLMAVQDFRADERALQLLRQVRGRAGRRCGGARMLVQTSQADHPVFARLVADGPHTGNDTDMVKEALAERRLFGYPPYVRMISITVRDSSEGQLWHICRDLKQILSSKGIDFAGPATGQIEFSGGMHIRQFWLKLPRNAALAATKADLQAALEDLLLRYRHKPHITVDVDPS